MRRIVGQLEVLKGEVGNFPLVSVNAHGRGRSGVSGQLKIRLFLVVRVEVEVAEAVDELVGLEVANLGDHHGEQRIGRNVEGDAKEKICASLVKLATEFPIGHVKLKECMAGRQGHQVKLPGVPCAYQMSSAFRIFSDGTDDLLDLMDASAIRFFPIRPLRSVDTTQVSVFISPFVPDRDLVVSKIANVGVAFQKPEELVNDRTQMKLFRGEKRKAFVYSKASLRPEDRPCSGPRSVATVYAFVLNVLKE